MRRGYRSQWRHAYEHNDRGLAAIGGFVGFVHYDEQKLIEMLSTLPQRLRVVFAALCAERLLPSYTKFCEQTGRGGAQELTLILQQLWEDLESEKMGAEEIQAKLDVCMSLIPLQDEGWLGEQQAYAEDAAAALAYALRTKKSGDPQEAAWAARRAYESIDHYVIHHECIGINEPGGEGRILSHPLVQAELLRQQRDLEDIFRLERRVERTLTLGSLRARAQADAAQFFNAIPILSSTN
jgi:uncharacterized protein YjaG (DUF416 family)